MLWMVCRVHACPCVNVSMCEHRVCMQRPKARAGRVTVPPHSAQLLLLSLLCRQLSTCYSMDGQLTTLLPPSLWHTLATAPEMDEAFKVASSSVPEYALPSVAAAVKVFTSPQRAEGQPVSLEPLAPPRSADDAATVPFIRCDANDQSPLARGANDAQLAAGLLHTVRVGFEVDWVPARQGHREDAVVRVRSPGVTVKNGPPLYTCTLPIQRSRFRYSAVAWAHHVTAKTVAVGLEQVHPSGTDGSLLVREDAVPGATDAIMRSKGDIFAVTMTDGCADDPVIWSLTCGAVRSVFAGMRVSRYSAATVDWSNKMLVQPAIQQVRRRHCTLRVAALCLCVWHDGGSLCACVVCLRVVHASWRSTCCLRA